MPALKDWFDAKRFQSVGESLREIDGALDIARFVRLGVHEIEPLNLMQRLSRMTEALNAILPRDYLKALPILKHLAPRIGHNFVTLVLPDYVSKFGCGHFEESMDALKFFTKFGSAEFAIREFIRRDLKRTLAVMEHWSSDQDEHVRRLASEGCRPRLPWSFRLEALIADPSPVAPILENLKTDPSLYVRKSVANHLNDIAKDHPQWVLSRLQDWPRENPHTAWIVKRALRTLIKNGDRAALKMIGAGRRADVKIRKFAVEPRKIVLGGRITITATLDCASRQRLVVDYAVHYVKKSGACSRKVFKMKEISVFPKDTVTITRSQEIRDFTTRVHHAGRHEVELMVNGEILARSFFDLECGKRNSRLHA